MYTAKVNDELFFDTNAIDKSLSLISANLDLTLGAAGLFTFTVPPSNVYYDHITILSDYIEVYRDDQQLFVGRVSSMKMGFDGNMEVEAEGLLTILNDTVIRPYGSLYGPEPWSEQPLKLQAYFPIIISYFLERHNDYYSDSETEKQILLGNVHRALQDMFVKYELDNFRSTYDCIKEFLDSPRYGGYISIRRTDGQLYLDWDYPDFYCDQHIDFGNNLLDINLELNAENYRTVLIPLGAELENETNGKKYRLTVYDVNDHKDYVETDGLLTNKIVQVQTWDDIEDADELLTEAHRALIQNSTVKGSITVTAVDLADAGYDISHFSLGSNIYVTSKPHGLTNVFFKCLSISLNLLNPADNKLTLDTPTGSYILNSQRSNKSNTTQLEHINSNYSTNTRLNEIKTSLSNGIQENSTAINQNAQSISLVSTELTNKTKVFTTQPTPPYYVGNVWLKAPAGGTNPEPIAYICKTAKEAGQTFSQSDWEVTYTDNGAISDLNSRVTTAEVNINANTASISAKVDKTNYNAAEIALMINNAGSSIQIQADHINLNGAVTANNYFKVNADGSVEINGGSINITTASASTNVIQLNYGTAYTQMFPGGMNLRSVPAGGSVSYYDLMFTPGGINMMTDAGRFPIEIQAYENVGYISVGGASANRIIYLDGSSGMIACRSLSAMNGSGITRVIVNGAGGQIIFRDDNGSNTGTINGTNYSGTAAVASKLGTATVGANNKPIYLNSGTATAVTNVMAGSATDTDARYCGAENKFNNLFCRVLGSSSTTKYAGLYQFAEGDITTAHWLASIEPDGTPWFASTSDKRVKDIIGRYSDEEAFDTLSVPVSLYRYKEDKSKRSQIGIIAQDLRDVQKRYGYRTTLIINDKEGNFLNDILTPEEDVLYGVDYTKLVPVLIKGWQMHEARIRELEKEISELKGGRL